MKLIGLIGGMSWQSSAEYYRLINELVWQARGHQYSARLVLYSVDFQPIEEAQREGRWDQAATMLSDAAAALKRAGADFIVLCTNTMHKVADTIERHGGLPLIHIADTTADAIKQNRLTRVGLLGTRFTMDDGFYAERLQSRYGLEVVLPVEQDRGQVHQIIYDELCHGQINEASRMVFQRIIGSLIDRGAEGVILGCTEIPLLVKPEDATVPLFDTTRIHAEAAVARALDDGESPG